MRYVADRSGRFTQRPHYEPKELDRECEAIVSAFLRERHGSVAYPLTTDDLTVLIERDTESLDQYADLSAYGRFVEGVTQFQPGRKPKVLISETLSTADNRQNRLRMTLAHEYGHVRFHAPLWDLEPPGADLLKANPRANTQVCFRNNILDAAQTDWMEWQAGYVCGAILMPKTAVLTLCRRFAEDHGIFGAVSLQAAAGADLISQVVSAFKVSADAARVRLLKLNLVTEAAPNQSLFS